MESKEECLLLNAKRYSDWNEKLKKNYNQITANLHLKLLLASNN